MKLRGLGSPWWWRGVAFALAVAGVIDPGFPALRRAKPELAIVAAEPGDTLLVAEIARELQRDFTVVSAPFSAAAATVIAGARLPGRTDELAAPVFAVFPEQRRTGVSLEAVQAPGRVPLDARVPVEVRANVQGARGRTLEITLQAGSVTVDRVTRKVTSDAARLRVPLAFVPTTTGSLPLRITAQLAGAAHAVAELDVNVHDTRWEILFYDTRPSWLSTFVRRALQRDPRFAVSSRVVTSRNISTNAGGPPATLSDLAALKRYSVIVVGAPETLTDRDVAGLDGFQRRRGGSVVLLFDQPARGPFERLTQVAKWSRATSRAAVPLVALVGDGDSLRASDVLWPAQLPAQARALARDPANRPVIWQSAAGAGQLIVSGALDAWRYRDAALSSFPDFWQALLAEAAESAPPAIDIQVAASRIEPGGIADLTVWLRDAALAADDHTPVRATVNATLEKPDGRDVLRLWPDGPVGRLRASLRAPATPGRYRIVVTSDGQRAELPIIVARNIARLEPIEHDLLRGWVVAQQGNTFRADELGQLAAALDRTIQPPARRQMTYPMRSAWWILPFALALAGEWWWRRRRGLP